MTETSNYPSIDEIAAVLRRLPGVVEATVEGDDNTPVAGITVKAEGRRSPKYVARDVETVLLTRFGIDIDYEDITIETAEGGLPLERPRLRIVTINSVISGAVFNVDVELEYAGKVLEGHRQGGSSRRTRLRLTCEAAVEALGRLCRPHGTVAFEGLTCQTVAGREVVAVVTNFILGGREQTVVGCAYVQRDECEAVVKATLSGLNDKLSPILAADAAS